MATNDWPPEFSLEQEKILNLLTGDRFYSNPSAALREAVLNAIDAVHRRRQDVDVHPDIAVQFDRDACTLTVSDNGVGMGKDEVTALFVKVGASAATAEAKKQSVGEFGIGVISYFMAGDSFTLHTYDGKTEPIGLSFDRKMLSGGAAAELPADLDVQGTTVRLQVRDDSTFNLLLDNFPHWCRDVAGLSALLLPDHRTLRQGGSSLSSELPDELLPDWVESAHLGPISGLHDWEAMTGTSTVAVLYRGVFVQDFAVEGLWGIQGTIDVDPKHFKPRLNREGFVEGQFRQEVTAFLQACHPIILDALVVQLRMAFQKGTLGKWTMTRWANLWLSLPRNNAYSRTCRSWDAFFRSIPAFEIAVKGKWEPTTFDEISRYSSEIYLAPLPEDNPDDLTKAALRLLRSTGRIVIRGIRRDRGWLRHASRSFGTTADLISSVFSDQLPPLVPIAQRAEQLLAQIEEVARLFTGPPTVDLVRLGGDSLPVLRLKGRLIINVDHESGRALVRTVLAQNSGPMGLVAAAARHTHEQLTQVAAVARSIGGEPEILGPIRRQYVLGLVP